MKVGSIHKNSRTRYFGVGGYFCFEEDKIKIKSKYKKENFKLKKAKKLDLDAEIKSYDMTEEEKIQIFSKIQDIETFHGCVKVFDKKYKFAFSSASPKEFFSTTYAVLGNITFHE